VKVKPVEQAKMPKKSENNSKNQSSVQTKPEFQSVDTGTCLSMVLCPNFFSILFNKKKLISGSHGRHWSCTALKKLKEGVGMHLL
jgi:DNA polymerase II small subunit/DNA polymerase delta subunit B